MSIYGSVAIFDGDDPDNDGFPAPLVYQRSHVLPHLDDPRGGSLDLGLISGWITRAGRCLHGDTATPGGVCAEVASGNSWGLWPYLRVAVAGPGDPEGAAVVLDAAQVRTLVEELVGWLDRTLPDPGGPK